MSKQSVVIGGIAVYPHLTSPDTVGEYADNKFKTKVSVAKEACAETIATIEAFAAANKVKDLPFKVDAEDETKVLFNTKTKYEPLVFAADGKTRIKPLDQGINIGGGTNLRVLCDLFAYKTGVSLQLKQVQIIDLVEYDASGFDAMEGSFDASEYAPAPEASFGEAEANDGGPDI